MNVLSIDFDIIMAPDIALYNALVHPGENGEDVTVDKLMKDFPMLNGCRADLNHYHKIVTYLMNNIQHLSAEDIRIAFNHEDIKYVLEKCPSAHVYNIDHHHDLGYKGPNGEVENKICTCANWGDFYFKKGNITEFTWIKNVNSDIPADYENNPKVHFIDLQNFNLEELPKMDKLFMCLSPEWTASSYFPLFYILLDIINNQKGCHLDIN